jgi:hypothetical protein
MIEIFLDCYIVSTAMTNSNQIGGETRRDKARQGGETIVQKSWNDYEE